MRENDHIITLNNITMAIKAKKFAVVVFAGWTSLSGVLDLPALAAGLRVASPTHTHTHRATYLPVKEGRKGTWLAWQERATHALVATFPI